MGLALLFGLDTLKHNASCKAVPPYPKLTLSYEVICHNDFAPYNCVYQDEHIIGIIDFDTAAPGHRIWDIAYAVYRFVPLMTDTHCLELGWQSPPNRASRLRKFCDAYGLDKREQLIDMVIQRIQALVNYMQDTSSNLDHIPAYIADIDYIRKNQSSLNEYKTDVIY